MGKVFIRTANATGVYEQYENCYAFAACSAYINTIMRIYGSRPPPSFADCYWIATYRHNGGSVQRVLQLLENHFHYGVQYKVFSKDEQLSGRLGITTSVIVCFSTSQNGWENITAGSLKYFPYGQADGWHAALVEGYDFSSYAMICKNSWGGRTASPRFYLLSSALHDYYFIQVYFTLSSIQGKTSRPFRSNIVEEYSKRLLIIMKFGVLIWIRQQLNIQMNTYANITLKFVVHSIISDMMSISGFSHKSI